MFAIYSLLTTVVLSLAVAANPVLIRDSPVTLPLVRRLNANGTAFNLLARDLTRVSKLKQSSAQRLSGAAVDAIVANVPVTNQVVDYVASVS